MLSDFNHGFKVHFDTYEEFAHTVIGFTKTITREQRQNWRYTVQGLELEQFMVKWYPNWWRQLQPII
jgi:sulfatase maturation enzyme AslB (radical SAM superfamily)